MTFKSKIKIITPGFAKELLERTQAAGVLNRKASPRTVEIYANEMRSNRWKLNSENQLHIEPKNILIVTGLQ